MEYAPTSLTSRELFEHIERTLSDDRAVRRRTGVILVELDLPPSAALVAELLQRLLSTARDGDAVGQLSPSRFVIVVSRLREVDALAQLVVRVTAALRSPIEVMGASYECPLTVTGSLSDVRSTAWSLVESALPHAHRATA